MKDLKQPVTFQIETSTIKKLTAFCGKKLIKQTIVNEAINEYIDSRVINRK